MTEGSADDPGTLNHSRVLPPLVSQQGPDDRDEFDEAAVDWAAVRERQAARSGILDSCCDLLSLAAGDDVLELGCGPGYYTERLARRVAPGRVYALDARRDALRYLRATAGDSPEDGAGDWLAEGGAADSLSHVRPLVGDAGSLPLRFADPTAVLAAFVLHHVEAPRRVVEAVAAAVPPGSPLLVVEYDPATDGEFGPTVERRIPRRHIREWLEGTGFAVDREEDFPEEKYAVLARRTTTDSAGGGR